MTLKGNINDIIERQMICFTCATLKNKAPAAKQDKVEIDENR